MLCLATIVEIGRHSPPVGRHAALGDGPTFQFEDVYAQDCTGQKQNSNNFSSTVTPSLNRQGPAPLCDAAWGRIIDRGDIHSVVASRRRRPLKHPGAKQFYAGR